jgi:hypothetical protein
MKRSRFTEAQIIGGYGYPLVCRPHSHSMVPGGFEVTSYTTRLMPRTSLMIRGARGRQHLHSHTE